MKDDLSKLREAKGAAKAAEDESYLPPHIVAIKQLIEASLKQLEAHSASMERTSRELLEQNAALAKRVADLERAVSVAKWNALWKAAK